MPAHSKPVRPTIAAGAVSFFDGILPVLGLAKAVVAGIPIAEPVIGGVEYLAQMVSEMKSNKESLPKLRQKIKEVLNVNASEGGEDLRIRLSDLKLKLNTLESDCEKLERKGKISRFIKASEYKGEIDDLKFQLECAIREFTFRENISIATVVHAIANEVRIIFLNDIVKGVAAGYEAPNVPEPCMKGTRVDIIADIIEQLKTKGITILSGPASAGKSAIAMSVATSLAKTGRLAASFFFSRSYAERNRIEFLAPTLARQLADFDPIFQQHLVSFLKADTTSVMLARPEIQFQKLVVDVLRSVHASQPITKPWIICLDALDECGAEKDLSQLLSWLRKSVLHLPGSVRFFLTGRPHVRYSLLKDGSLDSIMYDKVLETSDAVNDIKTYVDNSFGQVSWSKKHEHVPHIIQRAGGLFIYAATVVRYILDSQFKEDAASYILFPEGWSVSATDKSPLSPLHTLYAHILNGAIQKPFDPPSRKAQNTIMKILGTIWELQQPFSPQNLASLLMSMYPGSEESERYTEMIIRGMLAPLSSVIYLPEGNGPNEEIRIIHASFREYMMTVNEDRPTLVCCTPYLRQYVALNMLCLMNNQLRFNVCELPTSFKRNVELDLQVEQHISVPLQYSTRFWMDHVAKTTCGGIATDDLMNAKDSLLMSDTGIVQALEAFLFNKLLFWLEVLSLLKEVGRAPRALSQLITWIPSELQTSIVKFAIDAKRFISFFSDAITQSAPHIYLSALALAPTNSEITRTFRHHFPRLLSVEKGRLTTWPSLIATLEGAILPVAFSPNGKYIASGSSHHDTLYLWDAESAQLIGSLGNDGVELIACVTFSPDNKYIVSGGSDGTLLQWDAQECQLIGKFKAHTRPVSCVTFSPNGKHIAFGLYDGTVHKRDVKSFSSQMPVGKDLEQPPAMSVAEDAYFETCITYSETHIAAICHDRVILLWDSSTGELLRSNRRQWGFILNSITFSPEGSSVFWAEQSYESYEMLAPSHTNIHVWNWAMDTTEIIAQIPGQDSVVFSKDCLHLACYKWDNFDIMLFDLPGGIQSGSLVGHTDNIWAVAFSPDGMHIVSGASDGSVHMWDAKSKAGVQDCFEGPTENVLALAFSPDGDQIACGLQNSEIRFFDAGSCSIVHTPLDFYGEDVYSLKYSREGKYLTVITTGGKVYSLCLGTEAWSLISIGHPRQGDPGEIMLSSDGSYIAIDSENGLAVWNITSKECTWGPIPVKVENMHFSGDSKGFFFMPADTNTVSFLNIANCEIRTFSQFPAGWWPVAYPLSCQYSILLYIGNREVGLWDVENEVFELKFEGDVPSLYKRQQIHTNERYTLLAADGYFQLWETLTGRLMGPPILSHQTQVRDLAFSVNGSRFVSGGVDNTLRVWDMGTILRVYSNGSADSVDHSLIRSLRAKSTEPIRWDVERGWVTCRLGELLMWLPSVHRKGFWSPFNTLVVAQAQTMLGYDDFVFGEDWASCYEPVGSGL